MGGLVHLCFWKTRRARSFQDSVHRFRFTELRKATNSFSKVIGSGGFGTVYEGILDDGTKIAVKRRNSWSEQGHKEFRIETELCSGLRHRNVVSLLGFCDEDGEMMLVYEYMGQGTLASHLHDHGGSRCSDSCLAWNQRLKILLGAASGLHYLHTGTQKGIIHRDIKSSNILLDDNFVAKIADFGLSKTGPELGRSHVTTKVKGTYGYLDLEYAYSEHVTPGSDVYAFGVVLLEALSGRKALEEEWSLAMWAMKKLRDEGHLQEIVDRRIAGDITPDSLRKFGEIVGKCLEDNHRDRPSMEDVLSELKVVLQLQPAVSPTDDGTTTSGRVQNDGASTSQAPPKQTSDAVSPDICNRTHAASSSFQQGGDRTTASSSGSFPSPDSSSGSSGQEQIVEQSTITPDEAARQRRDFLQNITVRDVIELHDVLKSNNRQGRSSTGAVPQLYESARALRPPSVWR